MKPGFRRFAASAGFAAAVCGAHPASAQVAPPLGSADSFTVLAGSTVTNTGPSIITGDLGVSPGNAVTGFPPGLVLGGSIHAGDATAAAAQSSLTSAYNNLAGQACTQNLTGQNLGGLTLTTGVYCFDTSAQLTGTLTLDAQGNSAAVFVFKIGSTLTTASNSAVNMINSGNECRVFWQVGSSATLGTTTDFAGNILALTSITLNTGATVSGRVLARNGAVTLDTNTVGGCAGPPVCPIITISPAVPPTGTVGVPYNQQLTASGGQAPYTFSVVAGALPPGLTLTAGGLVSGTPTAIGTFTVRATDANGCFSSVVFTVMPAVCPIITITPAVPPQGTVGLPYSQQLTASGGQVPYTFSVVAGALPPGLTLSPGGLVSGTPTAAGTFTVRATDANGCFAQVSFTMAPAPCPVITLTPAVPPLGMVGVPYSQQITASGGLAPYTFTVVAGVVPPGMTVSATGLVSGTPTATGTFTVRGTDSNGCFAQITFTIAPAGCPVITLTPAMPPIGTVGLPYSQQITASGGLAPYTFSVTSGTVPLGITVTAGGLVSGTATTPGTFILRGTDSNNCFAAVTFTFIPAACPVITLSPALPPIGTVGVFYSQQITASGGLAPYTFSVIAGTLPPGMTVSAGGLVSGTPGAPGTFTVRAMDANACFADLTFSMASIPVPLSPLTFLGLFALLLTGAGYLRLRRLARAE